MTSSTLPEEIVEEILLRIHPDDPVHLLRATLVCKSWHSILSDDTFRRRHRRFHRTPPLQGYFRNSFSDSSVRFVPTTAVAATSPLPLTSTDVSAVCAPNKVYRSSSSSQTPSAMNCRHGRVLLEENSPVSSGSRDRLIVWDPITGSQQYLSLPGCPQYPDPYYGYMYAGAVLCAKENCDHLDCYGGPFRVVLVGMFYDSINDYENYEEEYVPTWASVYSSETGAWSSPTPYVKTNKRIDDMAPSLLIGDALYSNTVHGGHSIVKYDLCKHELSVMDLLAVFDCCILIKRPGDGVGFATMLRNCIYTWSWQVDNKGIGGSLQYEVMKLDDTLFPEGAHPHDLICMAEGTNTVFIRVKDKGLFTLDFKSRQVTTIGGKETYFHRPILPYMSFHTPKH